MKIILATDFSEENQMLFPYAIELLQQTGGTIHLFHAFEEQFMATDSSFPNNFDTDCYIDKELYTNTERIAKNKMNDTISFLQDEFDRHGINTIEISSTIVCGDPEFQLLHFMESHDADLILLGTQGSGRKSFLEGSLSKKLMMKSPIPMLSIHENYVYQRNSEILYVTNFDEHDIHSIDKVFELLKSYKPHIHVVHFIGDQDPHKAAAALEKLEKHYAEKDLNGNIHFQLVYTVNAREAMKLFCEENQISLVAFIPYRRRFIDYFYRDRISKDDFYELNVPLLTFSEP